MSIASFWRLAAHFRSIPRNGHYQTDPACLKGARSGSRVPGHLIDSAVLLTLDRTGVENFSADPLKPKTGFFIFPSPP